MPESKLYALPYSPWSEKARWALDHHHVRYREIEHTPMLGEPRLRLAAGRFVGRVSVPLLVTPHGAIGDSFEIAAFAERIGSGATLGLATHREALHAWNARSDTILSAGRALVLARLVETPAALDEALPKWVPSMLHPAMRPAARLGARFVRDKYGARVEDRERIVRAIRDALDETRQAVERGKGTVLGEFGYADVAMAVALQVVDPVADHWLRMGSATRGVWHQDELVRDYGDLLRWRDVVYERWRRPGDAKG